MDVELQEARRNGDRWRVAVLERRAGLGLTIEEHQRKWVEATLTAPWVSYLSTWTAMRVERVVHFVFPACTQLISGWRQWMESGGGIGTEGMHPETRVFTNIFKFKLSVVMSKDEFEWNLDIFNRSLTHRHERKVQFSMEHVRLALGLGPEVEATVPKVEQTSGACHSCRSDDGTTRVRICGHRLCFGCNKEGCRFH